MPGAEAAVTFPIAIPVMLATVNLGLVVYGQQAALPFPGADFTQILGHLQRAHVTALG